MTTTLYKVDAVAASKLTQGSTVAIATATRSGKTMVTGRGTRPGRRVSCRTALLRRSLCPITGTIPITNVLEECAGRLKERTGRHDEDAFVAVVAQFLSFHLVFPYQLIII